MLYFFFEESDMCIGKVMCFFNLLHSRRNWWNDKYLRCLYWSGNFDKGAISGEIETNLSNFVQFVQLLAQKQFQIIWNGTLSPESSYITNNQILEIISWIIAQIISQIIRYWKLSPRLLLKLYHKQSDIGNYLFEYCSNYIKVQIPEASREQKGDLMTATVYHKPPSYGTVPKQMNFQKKFQGFFSIQRFIFQIVDL